MLKRKETVQMQLELVTYDLLVRKDHLLRKIDQTINFSFIYRLCAPLYCADNGRPAIDPEVLFRMLFVGYLYGTRSEVRLCEEIQDNVAYRWFCKLGLTEKVPDEAVEADWERLGKKPLPPKDDHGDPPGRTIQQSPVDPDSSQLHKEGKPDGFHYSEHCTVDSKRNIIVNVHVTPANINDVDPIPEILRQMEERMGSLPEYMGLDAGYHNSIVSKQLYDKGIQPVLGYRRHTHRTNHFGKYRFRYDRESDCYICPEGHFLRHATTNREGYREYYSDRQICKSCPRREQCFPEKSMRRLVTRHVWQDYLDDATAFTKTPMGKSLYSWRKETIERSFADAKELHGMRTAKRLGLQNMR